MPLLNIELHKKYKSRDGSIWSITERLTKDDVLYNCGYRFVGRSSNVKRSTLSFTEDGRADTRKETPCDLIEEDIPTLSQLCLDVNPNSSRGGVVTHTTPIIPNHVERIELMLEKRDDPFELIVSVNGKLSRVVFVPMDGKLNITIG